jgi:hypothetical protein
LSWVTPSEYTYLTLQALLQMMHTFVKEAACFWIKGNILEFFSQYISQMAYSNVVTSFSPGHR